jgi:hypothetical protein
VATLLKQKAVNYDSDLPGYKTCTWQKFIHPRGVSTFQRLYKLPLQNPVHVEAQCVSCMTHKRNQHIVFISLHICTEYSLPENLLAKSKPKHRRYYYANNLCSSVSIVTRLGAGQSGFDFWQGQFSSFATAFRPALRQTNPPIRWVTGAPSLRAKPARA